MAMAQFRYRKKKHFRFPSSLDMMMMSLGCNCFVSVYCRLKRQISSSLLPKTKIDNFLDKKYSLYGSKKSHETFPPEKETSFAIIFSHEFLMISFFSRYSKIEANETHRSAVNFEKHKLNFSSSVFSVEAEVVVMEVA